jgi:hypothetical protein
LPAARPFNAITTDKEHVMALALTTKEGPPHVKRNGMETIQFRLILAVCFAVFLIAALFERLLPWSWRRQRPSPIAHAWRSAHTCTAYAFMG